MTTYLQGVEVPLPEGERLLWQGSPNPKALALHAFHARKIATYFGILIAIAAIMAMGEAEPMKYFLGSAVWLFLGGVIATLFAVIVAMLARELPRTRSPSGGL